MTKADSDLFKEFPEGTRRTLQAAWDALPADVQRNIHDFIPTLPTGKNRWLHLLDMVRLQSDMAFGERREVAIVGPANVGKSTLYNQFVREKDFLAAVSPLPGTTKVNQQTDTGLFTIIDTPGLDAVGSSAAREREAALAAATGADFLIILFDGAHGIRVNELTLYRELTKLGKPYIVVLNKMDLVADAADAVVAQAATSLELAAEQIVPISALTGDNVERVIMAAIKVDPALLAAFGNALPAYRWKLTWRAITTSAASAGVIALTPLPFADFLPLIGVQTSLVLTIARIYNYRLTWERARELVGVLGAGAVGRTVFYELAKLGGPPAWVLSAAVAGSTTVAIGYGAVLWFERGERLSAEARRELVQAVTTALTDALKALGQRRPERTTLAERIRAALEATDFGRRPPTD